jgi:RimJ/RimL family protein N-acetyltransferase
MRKLTSSVFEPNKASAKALIKNGFSECGRFHKQAFIREHGFVDELIFEKFNDFYYSDKKAEKVN